MNFVAVLFFVTACLLAGNGFCQNLLEDNYIHLMSVEEDIRMYLPVDVTWDMEGNSYILFQGSCQVLVVNSEFEIVGEFGACGEGPGEIGQGKTIEVLKDRIYVFQDYRLEIFDKNGQYLDRKTFSFPISDTGVLGAQIVVSTKDSDRLLVEIDKAGEVVGSQGPECKGETWDERFLECGGYSILDGCKSPVIVDSFSAKAFRKNHESWEERDWGISPGKTWNEGGAVYTSNSIFSACGLPSGDSCLVIYRDPGGGLGGNVGLLEAGNTIKPIGKLDSETGIRRMVVSPHGDLWVLYWSSEIRVFSPEYLEGLIGG